MLTLQPKQESLAFNIAIIGDGTSAVNALDAFLKKLEQKSTVSHLPLSITLYGKAPEDQYGKGFAYGATGARVGNLTEPTIGGHADYTAEKGAFQAFAESQSDITKPAPRSMIGSFHAQRYADSKLRAQRLGITLEHRQDEVVDIESYGGQYHVVTGEGYGKAADHVVLAVGDILSQRFNALALRLPNQAFPTPYHAIDKILADNGKDKHVVAFGTRSSFVDLANGLKREGYQGKITGVSCSGLTSWPTTPDAEALYEPQYLNPAKGYTTVKDVLRDLRSELVLAQIKNAYVPDSLIQDVSEQFEAETPRRLKWDFDPQAEHDNAGLQTYHQVAQAVSWEKIYEGLPNRYEKRIFEQALGDFILYNRVNRIVSDDFARFNGHIQNGDVAVVKGSFAPHDVTSTQDGRLNVALDNSVDITCDHVVNCAIGPVAALEQVKQVPLLDNLVKRHMIIPNTQGTGFAVNSAGIDMIGSQARPYSFSGLGIETYGRQVEAWAGGMIEKLEARSAQPKQHQTLQPFKRQEFKYG